MLTLDEYDDFHTSLGDSTYRDNTPTDDQNEFMATDFSDLKNQNYSIDEHKTYNKLIGVKIVLDKETHKGGNRATVTNQIMDGHKDPARTGRV